MYRFGVIGGDLRQSHLAKALTEKGFMVSGYGLHEDIYQVPGIGRITSLKENLKDCGVVLLPLPVTDDELAINALFSEKSIGIDELLDSVSKESLILGGKISSEFYKKCLDRGLTVDDYFKREEMSVMNAIPTAEGAIQIAMEETAITIHGAKCLVTGYGRIAKVLVSRLKALGAEVFVAVRKYEDLAWIREGGCIPLKLKEMITFAEDYDVIFNTVPATILGEDILSSIKESCVVIDLASKPGGVDFETARKLGIKAIWALSLPGKVAPITAGEIIAHTVLNILYERGVLHE